MGLQRIILALLLLLAGCTKLPDIFWPPEPVPQPTPITQEYPFNQSLQVAAPLVVPNATSFTWNWTLVPNTPDIAGFVLSLGTAPGTYTRTVDIPNKDARAYTATGLDLTKINYAILQSYTSFGLFSFPTAELAFAGTPAAPFQLGASPGL